MKWKFRVELSMVVKMRMVLSSQVDHQLIQCIQIVGNVGKNDYKKYKKIQTHFRSMKGTKQDLLYSAGEPHFLPELIDPLSEDSESWGTGNGNGDIQPWGTASEFYEESWGTYDDWDKFNNGGGERDEVMASNGTGVGGERSMAIGMACTATALKCEAFGFVSDDHGLLGARMMPPPSKYGIDIGYNSNGEEENGENNANKWREVSNWNEIGEIDQDLCDLMNIEKHLKSLQRD
jgi:hypothetical protein